MIKHIVFWTFKDSFEELSKEQIILMAEQKLNFLTDKIPQIINLKIGKNITQTAEAYDLVLECEFENENDLNTYQNHPEHLELVKWMRQVRVKRAVVDYAF